MESIRGNLGKVWGTYFKLKVKSLVGFRTLPHVGTTCLCCDFASLGNGSEALLMRARIGIASGAKRFVSS